MIIYRYAIEKQYGENKIKKDWQTEATVLPDSGNRFTTLEGRQVYRVGRTL